MLIDKYGPAWNLKTEHKAIYRTTMAMRLLCIMIKTGDSVKKTPPPTWVKQLKWMTEELGANTMKDETWEEKLQDELDLDAKNRKGAQGHR